ncbi:hypothetical protein F4809DRAFT_607750 [Biscogniauxia mediterranea]|nr:hypothetical protein F4809DRAFT_607750 [Biscogniauxia mediterranea]
MASRIPFKSSTAMRPAASFITTSRQVLLPAQRTLTTYPAMRSQESSMTDEHHDPEKHKQDLLTKQKQGKGHWKPELASDSEEAVKADRSAAEDVRTMQERTKRTAEETSKSGTSMNDGL